ncbi:MAG TPA: deoxyribonuclease IV, partial [Candidatus Babeliaceae bacterium]|nr:deoxyribonuclease IV [Candidatus Babeliaceae bacterium]
SSIGSKLEELALIREKLKPQERVGLCFDTCHAFAAGYDFTTPSTYKDFWSKFNDILGIENLKAIHLNDSKRGRGSLVDRHEHIGQGFIGMQTFSLIMNDPILEPIPKILETPKDNGFEDDRRNLGILHNLILKQQ